MKHKKMILVSLIVALGSQISIGLSGSDFIVSAGIIFFIILLYLHRELKPIPTGILSGIMVYILRLFVYYLVEGSIQEVILSYQLEALFYLFYSAIYSFLIQKYHEDNLNYIFLLWSLVTFLQTYWKSLQEI